MSRARDRSTEPLAAFRHDPDMRQAAGTALHATYTDHPEHRPPLDDVIDRALAVVAADTLDRAEDQAMCNKLDDCHATAEVLRHLTGWLNASAGVLLSPTAEEK